MSPETPRQTNRPNGGENDRHVQRRHFLALGAGVGATMLAGCSSELGSGDGGGDGTSSDGSNGGMAATGTFRLLISDQPVAIGDFDELNVSLDRARVFRGEGSDDSEDAESGDDGEDDTGGDDSENNETVTQSTDTVTVADTDEDGDATEDATDDDNDDGGDETEERDEDDDGDATSEDESDDDGQAGFFVVDLEGATVDLTEVVGEKAIGVFDGELQEGRYTKIELHVADVEGIVDGEQVAVKVPSNKLQIVKPFEVVAGETLTFVFDINVVKKGKTGEYNLLPVISESGVAGKDVEVEEVGNADDDSDSAEQADTEEDETDDAERTETTDD